MFCFAINAFLSSRHVLAAVARFGALLTAKAEIRGMPPVERQYRSYEQAGVAGGRRSSGKRDRRRGSALRVRRP